jgi:hypothetical protein
MSQPLQRLCDRFRALTRRMLLRLGLARLVSLVVVLAAGLILLDYFLRFDHVGRAAALAVLLAAAAWCVWADLVRPMRMRWSDEQVLEYLDRTLYGGHDRLTNYAELVRGAGVIEADRPGGGELLRQAVEALAGEVHRVDLRAAVRKKAVRRWQWAAAAIVLAAVGGGWIVQSVGTPRHAYAAIVRAALARRRHPGARGRGSDRPPGRSRPHARPRDAHLRGPRRRGPSQHEADRADDVPDRRGRGGVYVREAG